MPLPAPLSRAKSKLSKKDFGHVLIIAGSASMLGACVLACLAAMRSGAGLVTAAIPQDLNLALQAKLTPVVMTKPLAQTKAGAFSSKVYGQIEEALENMDAIAIGPGMGRWESTQRLVRELIVKCPKPMVVDADALFALSGHTEILLKAQGPRILTPHPGEMARLISPGHSEAEGRRISFNIEKHRLKVADDFARHYRCVLLLKGKGTVVASSGHRPYVNKTGNVGMATAGSGDVLTGMITAFLGQGLGPFEAARWGAYYHGQAGDHAARRKSKISLIATDIIESFPQVFIAGAGVGAWGFGKP